MVVRVGLRDPVSYIHQSFVGWGPDRVVQRVELTGDCKIGRAAYWYFRHQQPFIRKTVNKNS